MCSETGPFQFELRWQADRLDGQTVSDKLPLAIDVRSEGEDVHPLNSAPARTSSEARLIAEEMFFGREDIIKKIKRQLSTSHQANVILLEGNRRTGKTSILTHLQTTPDVLPDWIIVNCSFQGAEGPRRVRPVCPLTRDLRDSWREKIGSAVDTRRDSECRLPGVDLPDLG